MIRLPDVSPARPAKPTPVSRYQPDAEWSGPTGLGREAMLRDLALRRGWDLVDDDLAWIKETEQPIEAGTFGHADLVKAAGEGAWLRGEDFPRLFNLPVKRSAEAREYEAALPWAPMVQAATAEAATADTSNGLPFETSGGVAAAEDIEIAQSDDEDEWKKLQEYLLSIPHRQPDPNPNKAPSSHPLKQRYGAHEISKERVPFGEMAESANRDYRNRLTYAGHGLQKHANRQKSTYPKPPAEGAQDYNRLAAEIVDQILRDTGNMVVRTRDGRIDVWDSKGKFGIRFNRDGSFHSFREPGDTGN